WKMNTKILQDKKYNDDITDFLTYWPYEINNYPNIQDWWDEAKQKIKRITIKHSVRATTQQRRRIEKLTRQINDQEQNPTVNIDKINQDKTEYN
uniref:hypothetical protein n=1 Tax=Salmonella sp. s51933 TaxID=3160127 RepID=UPI003754CA4F